jgi:DNA/RNA endonuclease YhcR with UshA esterase domain
MKRWVFLLILSLTGTGTANAHHSFAATYYEDKLVTIEGELVDFQYRNPHSFVHVIVTDKEGNMQRWAIEWGAVSQLNRQGVGRFTLKPGDKVVITGAPARSGDDKLLMRKLVRPSDGFMWAAQVN